MNKKGTKAQKFVFFFVPQCFHMQFLSESLHAMFRPLETSCGGVLTSCGAGMPIQTPFPCASSNSPFFFLHCMQVYKIFIDNQEIPRGIDMKAAASGPIATGTNPDGAPAKAWVPPLIASAQGFCTALSEPVLHPESHDDHTLHAP